MHTDNERCALRFHSLIKQNTYNNNDYYSKHKLICICMHDSKIQRASGYTLIIYQRIVVYACQIYYITFYLVDICPSILSHIYLSHARIWDFVYEYYYYSWCIVSSDCSFDEFLGACFYPQNIYTSLNTNKHTRIYVLCIYDHYPHSFSLLENSS